MKSLIIDTLYIFSPEEKKACRISFSKGINIISTRQEDGTDRGKSVIMRSIYYTLGAEAFFDKNFSKHTKVFVLKICINDNNYFIYRAGSLFKFFDDEKTLIFTTIKSRELAKRLAEYTGFAVQLPDRQENKLEITPPVFNYLLFFWIKITMIAVNLHLLINWGNTIKLKKTFYIIILECMMKDIMD